MTAYSIHRLPKAERPRERLMQLGAESLSIQELIAILLGSGSKKVPILRLAEDLLMRFGSLSHLSEATLEELLEIEGIGLAKALQLKAVFQLSSRMARFASPPKVRIQHPDHAYQLIKDTLEKEKQEHFIVLLQDAKGCLICQELISIGTLTQTLVHPREVFYPAIRHKAASLIAVHNHPSGDPSPSEQDLMLTRHLIEVGKLIGIPLQDHLIIGCQSYCSLRQHGLVF